MSSKVRHFYLKGEINIMSKKYVWVSGITGILLLAYFYALNVMEPLFADDFAYSFIFATDTKVTSLLDIFQSLHVHYFTWGGRLVAHFFGQLFLLLGKPIFNIMNAIMMVLLIGTILCFVRLRMMNRVQDVGSLLAVVILCWFGLPNFGETSIWLIGSVNYLWTTVFIMLFLFPYRYLAVEKPMLKDNYLIGVCMALLGFLAGMTNENTGSIACMLVAILYVYLKWIKSKKLPNWFYTGGIGVFLGFATMIVAPGNNKRSEAINYHAPLLQRLKDYAHNLEGALIEQKYLLLVLAILLVINIFALIYFKAWKLKKENVYFAILFMFAGFMSFFIMIASPIFPIRASYGGAAFLIVACLFLIENLNIELKFSRVQAAIVVVFTVVMLISMFSAFKGYVQLNRENTARIATVNENKNKNNYDIILPLFTDGNRYVFVRDIEDQQFAYYFNKYYGLSSVIAEDQAVLDALENKDTLYGLPSILDHKNFYFYKSITINDIKLIKEDNKEYLLFIFRNDTNVNDMSNLRFFINAFPLNNDISLLQEDRQKFGYDNWDMAPVAKKINGTTFFVREINGNLGNYQNIEMGFYSVADGRKGNVLGLNKEELAGKIEPSHDIKTSGKALMKEPFKLSDNITMDEFKLNQFSPEELQVITRLAISDYQMLHGMYLFIHAYPADSEINNLPAERVKFGYANWDFELGAATQDGFWTHTAKSRIRSFKKIDIGLYNEKGNIGKVLTLYDVQL